MKKKKTPQPRNYLVKLALFRKAGSHRKSNKAIRRLEKSKKMYPIIDIIINSVYNRIHWADSSVGQSRGLIILWSKVQVLLGPPKLPLQLSWQSTSLVMRMSRVRIMVRAPSIPEYVLTFNIHKYIIVFTVGKQQNFRRQ